MSRSCVSEVGAGGGRVYSKRKRLQGDGLCKGRLMSLGYYGMDVRAGIEMLDLGSRVDVSCKYTQSFALLSCARKVLA